jgi:outer membrane protein
MAAVCRGQQPMALTLVEAERLAIQNQPLLAAARLNASAAAQVPIEIGAAQYPLLYGAITGAETDNGSRIAAGFLNNPALYSRVGTGLSLSQLITDFGRTSSLVASADFHSQAQQQTTEFTRSQILLAVDRAYFAELRARAVLRVAEQTVSARQLVADQVAALARSNLKSTLDVSFANVNLSDARLLLASAQNNIASAEAELATALGIPGQAQQGGFNLADVPLPDMLPSSVQPLLAAALRDRPDAAGLRLDQTSAERFAKAEKDLIFPTVAVAAAAGFAPAGVVEIPGRYGGIGLNVSIPVLNGRLFRARRTEAELRAQAAQQNVRDLENRIARDVQVAYLNSATAFQRLSLTAELLQQAQLAADLAQSRYDIGLGSIVELSQAQLNVTAAQIANSSAQYDYQSERANLAYQTGALR